MIDASAIKFVAACSSRDQVDRRQRVRIVHLGGRSIVNRPGSLVTVLVSLENKVNPILIKKILQTPLHLCPWRGRAVVASIVRAIKRSMAKGDDPRGGFSILIGKLEIFLEPLVLCR